MLNRNLNLKDGQDLSDNEIFQEFPDFLPIQQSGGMHLSTCGHAVHQSCLIKIRNNQRTQHHSLRTNAGKWKDEKNEFSCLLCNRLCNISIPIIPKKMHTEARKVKNDEASYGLWEWINGIEDEMAPDKKFKKKTYVIRLGTFDVNDFTPIEDTNKPTPMEIVNDSSSKTEKIVEPLVVEEMEDDSTSDTVEAPPELDDLDQSDDDDLDDLELETKYWDELDSKFSVDGLRTISEFDKSINRLYTKHNYKP